MWVTDKQLDGSALFWRQAGEAEFNVVPANVSTYDAGMLGWHKRIYTAVMGPLIGDVRLMAILCVFLWFKKSPGFI